MTKKTAPKKQAAKAEKKQAQPTEKKPTEASEVPRGRKKTPRHKEKEERLKKEQPGKGRARVEPAKKTPKKTKDTSLPPNSTEPETPTRRTGPSSKDTSGKSTASKGASSKGTASKKARKLELVQDEVEELAPDTQVDSDPTPALWTDSARFDESPDRADSDPDLDEWPTAQPAELSEEEENVQYLKGLLEALLFTSDRPLTPRELARAAGLDKKRTEELLAELVAQSQSRGVQLVEVAGGWAMRSNPTYAAYVQKMHDMRPVRLTRAQLETLAIVAYRQPITRPEIDDVRGVDSGQVIKGLLDRDLIKILGKKEEAGRPILYGTAPGFLELFSLESLKDMPPLREFTELTEESREKFESEVGEPAPAEFPVETEFPIESEPPADTFDPGRTYPGAGIIEAAVTDPSDLNGIESNDLAVTDPPESDQLGENPDLESNDLAVTDPPESDQPGESPVDTA